MFLVQAILPCILSSLYVSQAFFLGPLVSRTGLPASRQYKSTRVCRCSQHSNWYGGGGRSRGRGTEGALWMNHLEEVPDALSDKVLELECPETGRVLECYAERIAVVNGQRYLAAYPKDPAVAVAFDEDGQVAPVPIDDPLMDKLFPLAQACMADLGLGITLLRTPASLTAKGLDKAIELLGDEADEEDMDVDDSLEDYDVEGGEDDGEIEEEDEEEEDEFFDEGEEVELLGEFFLEGEEFLMVRFLEPLLMLAIEKEPGRFVLLSEEEDQDANPAVEEMLSGEAL